MDLRIEKTRKNIIDTFIRLRSQKPLIKITVKELAEQAKINKATFYRHFGDIYDLSDYVENEILKKCVDSVPAELLLTGEGFEIMVDSFLTNRTLINILFSEDRRGIAVQKIDMLIQQKVASSFPEGIYDISFKIKLTVLIYGYYNAFFQYQYQEPDLIRETLCKLTSKILS